MVVAEATNQATPLRAVLAERVRSLRLASGFQRQDDLADHMAAFGLGWNRDTVAAIETGRRGLSLEESLILAVALGVPVSSLLAGDGAVQLTEGFAIKRSAAAALLRGETIARLDRQVIRTPVHDVLPELERMEAAGKFDNLFSLWPNATTEQLVAAARESRHEAERKLARKLGIDPTVVSVAAFARWGRSLTAERDQRAAESAPEGATARSVQAIRRAVTLRLTDELRPVLADYAAAVEARRWEEQQAHERVAATTAKARPVAKKSAAAKKSTTTTPRKRKERAR